MNTPTLTLSSSMIQITSGLDAILHTKKHLLKKYTTYFGFSFSPVKSI